MPGHHGLRNRITIPYVTPAGVRSIKGRAFHGEEPKYDGPPGLGAHLYNAMAFHTNDESIAITEGEFDAMVMQSQLGIPTVGVPGTSVWKSKPHFKRCFAGYHRVFVLTDNDAKPDGKNPGQELAALIVRDLGDQAVHVPPPTGMDLTEWFLAEGPDAIRKACGL